MADRIFLGTRNNGRQGGHEFFVLGVDTTNPADVPVSLLGSFDIGDPDSEIESDNRLPA